MSDRYSEVFVALVSWSQSLGAKSIKDLPGCWESHVGGSGWWVAINGHDVPTKNTHGGVVPPFSAWIEWNGWPAGLVGPRGGTLVVGEAANEDSLIAALRAEVARGET